MKDVKYFGGEFRADVLSDKVDPCYESIVAWNRWSKDIQMQSKNTSLLNNHWYVKFINRLLLLCFPLRPSSYLGNTKEYAMLHTLWIQHATNKICVGVVLVRGGWTLLSTLYWIRWWEGEENILEEYHHTLSVIMIYSKKIIPSVTRLTLWVRMS